MKECPFTRNIAFCLDSFVTVTAIFFSLTPMPQTRRRRRRMNRQNTTSKPRRSQSPSKATTKTTTTATRFLPLLPPSKARPNANGKSTLHNRARLSPLEQKRRMAAATTNGERTLRALVVQVRIRGVNINGRWLIISYSGIWRPIGSSIVLCAHLVILAGNCISYSVALR